MEFSKKVIRIGSSLGIILDRLIVENLKIKKGDKVHVILVNESRLKNIKEVKNGRKRTNKER